MQKQIDEVMALVKVLGGKHYAIGVAEMQDRDAAVNKIEVDVSQMEKAIETKLRELLPVWQPIDESTPTDGREVLAGFQGQFRWVTAIAVATANHGVYAAGYGQFTHWMPLP